MTAHTSSDSSRISVIDLSEKRRSGEAPPAPNGVDLRICEGMWKYPDRWKHSFISIYICTHIAVYIYIHIIYIYISNIMISGIYIHIYMYIVHGQIGATSFHDIHHSSLLGQTAQEWLFYSFLTVDVCAHMLEYTANCFFAKKKRVFLKVN